MERLTKTYSDGTHGAADNLPCGENSYTYKGLLLEALGKYEDAEEQGLLLQLPCKVGDTVYKVTNNADACYECDYFERGYCCDDWCNNNQVTDEDGDTYLPFPQHSDYPLCGNHFWEVISYQMNDVDKIVRNREKFNKTIFLTKEEAEQKLKEMERIE